MSCDKVVHFFGGGQQARQIKRHAADQGALSASGEGCKPSLLSRARTNASIGVFAQPAGLHWRNGGPDRLFKRPMGPIVRALRNPLLSGWRFPRASSAWLRPAATAASGSEGPWIRSAGSVRSIPDARARWRRASPDASEGGLFQIKAQAGFAHFRIGPMATEAVAGQDRLHILVEVEMLPAAWEPARMSCGCSRGCGQQGQPLTSRTGNISGPRNKSPYNRRPLK